MLHHPWRLAPIMLFGSLAFAAASGSTAPREKVVYAFQGGSDGNGPFAGLIAGQHGTLYGTTSAGGDAHCDCGVVFKLTHGKSGYTESVLYSFTGGRDGAVPFFGGLIADANGALYGTTSAGGNGNACRSSSGHPGCGTVFKLTPAVSGYAESVLYRFKNGTDGAYPYAGLIADGSGALYGTTADGGGGGGSTCGYLGCGTVFKLTPTRSGYKESVLYRFQGGSDGSYIETGLVADASGALYGTTNYGGGSGCGGIGCGTAYKLTPARSGYTKSLLHAFQGGNDGAGPSGNMIIDNGVLYGTTFLGGSGCGCGIVFKLTPAASGYTEQIAYSFRGHKAGASPDGGLIGDGTGALYGTTIFGGHGKCPGGPCGVVFKLTPAGSGYTERILHVFTGGNDGAFPYGNLLIANGALFGTTSQGGGPSFGSGTVFKVTP